MKRIQLSRGLFCIVDDDDFETLSVNKWCCSTIGYAVRNSPVVNGKSSIIYMHREIMLATTGVLVDHINGDKLDNRKINLRLCTKAQNQRNSKKRVDGLASRFRGVTSAKKGRYKAEITVNGRRYYLGTFLDEEAAARKYDEAAIQHHAEFARLNFRKNA